MVEEVEQHRLSPLEVIDMKDHGTRARQRLKQPPHLPEELLRRRRAAARQVLAHRLARRANRLEGLKHGRKRNPLPVGQATPA